MSSKFRDPVSGLTHLFAAIASLGGLIALLIIGWGNTGRVLSLLVYGLSLILLFSASASYHLLKAASGIIEGLRKFDHIAIYLLIAGTYTPICFNLFTGFWKWGMLSIIWALALIGLSVKLFIIKVPRWVNAGVYLIMGWLCILAVKEMLLVMSAGGLTWLFIGGVAYSLGAVIYMTKILNVVPGVFGFHEVWHIFVILGAAAHFVAILISVAPLG